MVVKQGKNLEIFLRASLAIVFHVRPFAPGEWLATRYICNLSHLKRHTAGQHRWITSWWKHTPYAFVCVILFNLSSMVASFAHQRVSFNLGPISLLSRWAIDGLEAIAKLKKESDLCTKVLDALGTWIPDSSDAVYGIAKHLCMTGASESNTGTCLEYSVLKLCSKNSCGEKVRWVLWLILWLILWQLTVEGQMFHSLPISMTWRAGKLIVCVKWIHWCPSGHKNALD